MREQILAYCHFEFGWELMCWQAHLRWLSQIADIRIITRPNREFLYKDFAKEILTYEFDGEPDGVSCVGMNKKNFDEFLNKNKKDSKILHPYNLGYYPTPTEHRVTDNFYKQKFIKFQSDTLEGYAGVILHARNRKLAPQRNWGRENWEILVKYLLDCDVPLTTIGTSEALSFDGVTDRRNIPLEDTVALMNRSSLIIGESSGAMHLAALAGLTSVVWGRKDNKQRYENYWNPLNTPTYFIDGHQPDINLIKQNIQIAIN